MAVCSSALRSTSTRLPPGRLDSLSTDTLPWYGAGQRNSELCCVFTACCRALGNRQGIIRGDNLTTLERCSVRFSLSRFSQPAFSAPGTNGGMQRCYSLLVMLESQFHISFCVRDLIVFVCHCCQINSGVAWRTEPPPLPPSPLSVPPDSHHSQLARVYLPLLSCPPLCVKLRLSCSPAPYCLLSHCLCSFKAGSLLHDLLENSFLLCSPASQFLSPSRFHLYNCRMFLHKDWSPSTPFHFPLPLPCPDLLPSNPHPVVLYLHPLLFAHTPSLIPPNLFHPLDHVAMCLLAPIYPHLAVLFLMDLGGKLPSNLPVPRSSHCGLQRPWADPSTRWDPLGCAQAIAGWQLDTPHSLRLPGSVQWLGLPGPPEQYPLPYRTRDAKHLIQAGVPGPGQ